MNMETIYTTSEYLTMFVLLVIMIGLVFLIKYLDGDFSPTSIEEVDRQVIGKKVVITYKKTYKDGRIKMSYKTIL